MNATTIIIVLVLVGAALFFLRKKKPGSSGGGFLDKLFPKDTKAEVDRLKAEKESEDRRTMELRALLEAKQELAKSRNTNEQLEKEISKTGKQGNQLSDIFPSAKLRKGP